jgi:hypothetical protein
MPCSAVTGANLVEGLDWIVSDVAGRLYYSTTVPPPPLLATKTTPTGVPAIAASQSSVEDIGSA